MESDADTDEQMRILGPHFRKWKAERIAKEKYELGMEECADSELQRVKEHLGADYERWKAANSAQPPPRRAPGHRLYYTSGTTGRPKAVLKARSSADTDAAGATFSKALFAHSGLGKASARPAGSDSGGAKHAVAR